MGQTSQTERGFKSGKQPFIDGLKTKILGERDSENNWQITPGRKKILYVSIYS